MFSQKHQNGLGNFGDFWFWTKNRFFLAGDTWGCRRGDFWSKSSKKNFPGFFSKKPGGIYPELARRLQTTSDDASHLTSSWSTPPGFLKKWRNIFLRAIPTKNHTSNTPKYTLREKTILGSKSKIPKIPQSILVFLGKNARDDGPLRILRIIFSGASVCPKPAYALKTKKYFFFTFFSDSLGTFEAKFWGGISTFIFKNGHTEFLDFTVF